MENTDSGGDTTDAAPEQAGDQEVKVTESQSEAESVAAEEEKKEPSQESQTQVVFDVRIFCDA